MRNLERVRSAVFGEPWAILPTKLEAIMGVLEASDSGDITAAATSMRNSKPELELVAGVPVIPVVGVIAKRMNLFHAISGGCSTEVIGRLLDEAVALDPPAIILSIDSPGGSIAGTPEFASHVRDIAANSTFPVVAYADGMAASAAYWIGSQCDALYASEAAVVGSIGVIAAVYDDTRRMRNEGIDPVVIRSSDLKAASAGPGLLDDMPKKRAIAKEVGVYFEMFKAAVEAGRNGTGIDIEEVSTGEVWVGKQAVEVGLADGITTLERLAESLSAKKKGLTINNTCLLCDWSCMRYAN